MGYTRQDIISFCDKAITDIGTFYQQDIINYCGKSSDTDELFTEIIAEYVLNHIDDFKCRIPMISRLSSYNINHDGSYREGTGRDEEIIAIKMFLQSKQELQYEYIGQIIDYQTPLKSKRSDLAGKIDLLSFDGKVLRVLELKKPMSEETLLRCVLEAYTYLCTVDKKKLLGDFELPANTIVKASPFVFRNGEQWKEWNEHRPMLKKLMDELDSKTYFINEIENKYKIMEV